MLISHHSLVPKHIYVHQGRVHKKRVADLPIHAMLQSILNSYDLSALWCVPLRSQVAATLNYDLLIS